MAKKKPVRKPVNDPVLLRTGLDGFEELTRLIRQLSVDSESRAAHGEPNAYLDLQHLLREVRTLADSGKSALMADVSNPTAEMLTENCRIALTSGNCTDFHDKCGTCIRKIAGWQPAPRGENTRPLLLIGTVEKVREKRARLTDAYFNHPDRVADREGQKAIRLAVNVVLESLNTMSSSFRMKLVGQGAGEHSNGRSWRQDELDEANQRYISEGVMLLELANQASALFAAQPASEKRRLLDFVLSNCSWKAGELTPVFRQPFDIMVDMARSESIKKVAGGLSSDLCQDQLPG